MCHDVRIARGATRIAPTVCGHEPLQVCAAIASHPCCPGVAEDVKVHESKLMWRQSALVHGEFVNPHKTAHAVPFLSEDLRIRHGHGASGAPPRRPTSSDPEGE